MQRITILAEINSYSGYGHHFTHVFRELQRRGYFVSVRPIRVSQPFAGATVMPDVQQAVVWREQNEEWEILIAPPFHVPTPGKKTVYWTMWESTELTAESVRVLNLADVIVVPCFWCADVFEKCGVTKPIAVIPLGIDPKIFNPPGIRTGDKFVFGTAGRIVHGGIRKGVAQIIPVFEEAFPDNPEVKFRIKVHPDDPIDGVTDPRIEITRSHMTDEEVAHWLAGLDCFVTGATGEGFGLWQLQAMAMGRPVIGAIYGGLREFMTPDNSYPVTYEESKAEGIWPGKWARPNWVSMNEQMRAAFGSYAKLYAKGARAAQTAKAFTWQKATDLLEDVLCSVGAVSGAILGKTRKPERPKQIEFPNEYPRPVLDQIHKLGWNSGRVRFEDAGENIVHFNSAIIEAERGRTIFARRATVDKDGNRINSQIVAYLVDSSWYAAKPLVIDLGEPAEDPRVINRGATLLLSYTGIGTGEPKQKLAILGSDLKVLTKIYPPYGNNIGKGQEKNWIWFEDQGLRFIYKMSPHTVIAHATGQPMTTAGFKWAWGGPRGGTPPVRVGKEYIRFFHSTLPWKNDRRRYYWVGAYAFQAHEPYRVTRVIQKPFLAGYPNDEKTMTIAHAVVFPMGVLFDGITWTLLIGHNDEDTIWMNIPHEWLQLNLQPQ